MSLLVVGLGNILLRDEGVGVRMVERLEGQYRIPSQVEILDGGTSAMELIHTIADRQALIVCDAVRSDSPPGTLIRLGAEQLPAFFRTKLSPHQLGLSDVLATLKLLDRAPPHLVLIGVVPMDLDLGLALSPCVEAALEGGLEMLIGEIEALGYPMHPRVGSASPISHGLESA